MCKSVIISTFQEVSSEEGVTDLLINSMCYVRVQSRPGPVWPASSKRRSHKYGISLADVGGVPEYGMWMCECMHESMHEREEVVKWTYISRTYRWPSAQSCDHWSVPAHCHVITDQSPPTAMWPLISARPLTRDHWSAPAHCHVITDQSLPTAMWQSTLIAVWSLISPHSLTHDHWSAPSHWRVINDQSRPLPWLWSLISPTYSHMWLAPLTVTRSLIGPVHCHLIMDQPCPLPHDHWLAPPTAMWLAPPTAMWSAPHTWVWVLDSWRFHCRLVVLTVSSFVERSPPTESHGCWWRVEAVWYPFHTRLGEWAPSKYPGLCHTCAEEIGEERKIMWNVCGIFQ